MERLWRCSWAGFDLRLIGPTAVANKSKRSLSTHESLGLCFLSLQRISLRHPIANAALRKDKPWIVGVVAKLAAQVFYGSTKQLTFS